MPLLKGKSDKAFKHNVSVEYKIGKPLKQSLAIAYSMKKKSPKHLAKGGQLTNDNYESSCSEHCESPCQVHEQASGFVEHEGDDKRPNEMALHEDERSLNEHGEIEEGPEGHETAREDAVKMAEGGMMQSEDPKMDMVGRIMKQRQQMFSKGGQVANDTNRAEGAEHRDDMGSGRYDDLVNRDELEFNYTGANSGDELSDAGENDRRHDIVSRIMASRKKKDRLPNPR